MRPSLHCGASAVKSRMFTVMSINDVIKHRSGLASFSVEIDNDATELHELIADYLIAFSHVFQRLRFIANARTSMTDINKQNTNDNL